MPLMLFSTWQVAPFSHVVTGRQPFSPESLWTTCQPGLPISLQIYDVRNTTCPDFNHLIFVKDTIVTVSSFCPQMLPHFAVTPGQGSKREKTRITNDRMKV